MAGLYSELQIIVISVHIFVLILIRIATYAYVQIAVQYCIFKNYRVIECQVLLQQALF